MGHQPEAWHDLFVAVAGAAAALGGLTFVAVSLNLDQVLKSSGLPPLAARSLMVLIGLLLMSILVLTPGQSPPVLGFEILGLGIVVAGGAAVSAVRTHLPVTRWSWTVPTLFLALVSTLPMALAGASLVAGTGGGLYWALVETCLGFATATYNSWILLVEIRR